MIIAKKLTNLDNLTADIALARRILKESEIGIVSLGVEINGKIVEINVYNSSSISNRDSIIPELLPVEENDTDNHLELLTMI